MAGATIMLLIVNRSGVFPSTVSDRSGFFRFDDVRTDVLLELDASKEEAYLINPRTLKLGFPAGGKSPTLRVRPGENLTDQVVQFGPPGGRFIIEFKSPDGKKGWGRNFKWKISKKGEKPPFGGFFFPPFDVVVPAGRYEMQLFSQDGRYFKTIEIVVERRKITRQVVEVSPEFVTR